MDLETLAAHSAKLSDAYIAFRDHLDIGVGPIWSAKTNELHIRVRDRANGGPNYDVRILANAEVWVEYSPTSGERIA